MSNSNGGQAESPGERSLVGRYFEEAREAHRLRLEREPLPLGDQPERLARLRGELTSERMGSLLEPYLFYVVQIASEFKRRDVCFSDLLAEGNMGLVEAAHHFDPDRKVKFLTYATWWIRKRILEYLAAEGKTVRLTRYAREKRRELASIRESLTAKLGREPTLEELSQATGFERRTLVDLLASLPYTLSIEKQVTLGVGVPIKDTLVSNSRSPEELLTQRSMLSILKEEIARLPSREREIIEDRFALDGGAPATFQEIGERMGLSRERARQIEQQGLERLRRRIHRRTSVRAVPERLGGRIRRRAKRRSNVNGTPATRR